MTRGYRWLRAIRFRGPDVEADVADEIGFHIESLAADLIAGGMAPDEARREAHRRFGDRSEVESWLREHDRRKLRRIARAEHFETVVHDIRYGARKLRQQPGFTAAVVSVLALGIGAATAMFTLVDAALLRPLPFSDPERLVILDGVSVPFELDRNRTSPQIDEARALPVFREVAAYAPGGMNLSTDDAAARVRVGVVTPNFFETIGVPPLVGRPFAAAEGEPGASGVAILSHGVWRRHFGADEAALERELLLNGRPYRIVGVMPRGFHFPREAEVWIPLRLPFGFDDIEPFRSFMPSSIVARLAPGATREQASALLLELLRRYERPDRPVTATAAGVVKPMREHLVGQRRTALIVLLGATGLVLLIACANATNLLLSRAAARRREIALRAALGASRSRILRQLLMESIMLALAGGMAGVLLAILTTDALAALIPAQLAGIAPPRVDLRVLGFSFGTAVLTGILFGLWPALGAMREDPLSAMKGDGTGTAGEARHSATARRTFVVAELALATMLVIGAGLMLRSLQSLMSADPGVRPEQVATLELTLPKASYGTRAVRQGFANAVLERLGATDGIQHAAIVNELPLRGVSSISVTVNRAGEPMPPVSERVFAQLLKASPGYFSVLGIPLLRGSGFSSASGASEIIINQELAKLLWPGEDPIGRQMDAIGETPRTVVGVVGDVRAVTLESEIVPQMYLPLGDFPSDNLAIVVRGALPPTVLANRLRQVVAEVDPAQAVYNVRAMEEVIARAIGPRRLHTALIAAFGGLALALAAVGVYGVLAFAVVRRRHELGIRIALGAGVGDVVGLVARESLLLLAAGLTLGLAGAWALRRVLESLLYGITPADPISYIAAPLLLAAAAALATLLPAWRATRVDPMQAIRVE